MWASGARSPDAPTEPSPGITGTTPVDRQASSASSVAQRTPDAPWASDAILRARMRRTIGTGSGSPTPAECDITMLR